jgi:hypothetical protein
MKTVIDRLRDMREVELLLATDCDCRPEDTQNWQNAATLAEAIDMLAAPPQPVPAEPPDMRFRLRMARLLAELHGDEYLSEQQCARYMGIDLVSWRRLERCFTAGAHFVEGEGEEFPSEDSETVLRAALAATEAMSGEQEASAPPQPVPAEPPALAVLRELIEANDAYEMNVGNFGRIADAWDNARALVFGRSASDAS